MNPRNPKPARRMPPENEVRGGHFTAPLGPSMRGRLRFAGGAHRLVVQADSRVRGLCCARFCHQTPTVVARGGTVTIRYPRFPTDDWLDCGPERPDEIALNASVSWDIEIRGGALRLTADLRGLRLGSFHLEGGAGRLELTLPAPRGAVAVTLLGGVSDVRISRPAGAAVRLRVEGGATNLTFDERQIGVAGGEVDLPGRGYEAATDRYDIAVTGGANNLSLDQRRERRRP